MPSTESYCWFIRNRIPGMGPDGEKWQLPDVVRHLRAMADTIASGGQTEPQAVIAVIEVTDVVIPLKSPQTKNAKAKTAEAKTSNFLRRPQICDTSDTAKSVEMKESGPPQPEAKPDVEHALAMLRRFEQEEELLPVEAEKLVANILGACGHTVIEQGFIDSGHRSRLLL